MQHAQWIEVCPFLRIPEKAKLSGRRFGYLVEERLRRRGVCVGMRGSASLIGFPKKRVQKEVINACMGLNTVSHLVVVKGTLYFLESLLLVGMIVGLLDELLKEYLLACWKHTLSQVLDSTDGAVELKKEFVDGGIVNLALVGLLMCPRVFLQVLHHLLPLS